MKITSHSFQSEVSIFKPSEVIEKYLSTLSMSPLSAAFHCAIRVSYALKFKMYDDLAHSFAYWAVNFNIVPPIEKKESTININLLDMDYMNSYKLVHGTPPGNISGRAEYGMNTPEFECLFNQLGFKDDIAIAKNFALQVMSETLDFTALHLITGTHAIQEIKSHIPGSHKLEIVRRLMPSLLATFLSMTKAKKRSLTLDIETNVEEVRKIGANSLNDHVVKLCYVAIEEFEETGNNLYLQLAKQYSNL